MTAIADILKRLDVSDELIPEGKQHEIPREQTLARLSAVFAQRLETDASARADEAVRTLRTINTVRWSQQHGTGSDLAKAFAKLQLRLEPGNWAAAWDGVRRRLVEALSILREELQLLVP